MDDTDPTSRTFVLVHGGGHGGWCWKPTARLLRKAGHEVYAPTLTGFGERFHLADSAPDFETFVTDIVNVLDYEDLSDVVLVGHSMGGVVVPRVAERAPQRIRRVVWLAGVVCDDGESLLQAVQPSPEMAAAVTVGPDGAVRQDNARLVAAVLNDGTPEQRAWVLARHRPYPTAALTEPGRLSAFLRLGLPTAYILATRDCAVPPDSARRFVRRLPGARALEIDAGHDCMISRPEETARLLLAASA
jgi:pimeloyl-ACP methyl ester carboxylesterase